MFFFFLVIFLHCSKDQGQSLYERPPLKGYFPRSLTETMKNDGWKLEDDFPFFFHPHATSRKSKKTKSWKESDQKLPWTSVWGRFWGSKWHLLRRRLMFFSEKKSLAFNFSELIVTNGVAWVMGPLIDGVISPYLCPRNLGWFGSSDYKHKQWHIWVWANDRHQTVE